MSNLKTALEGVEKERDYYFGKLREVEMLCQEHAGENATFVDQLLEILYSSYDQVSLWLQIQLNQSAAQAAHFCLKPSQYEGGVTGPSFCFLGP